MPGFNPQEPRDKNGMWSRIPGYVHAKASENKTDEEKQVDYYNYLHGQGIDTQHLYIDEKTGDYTPERQQLHEQIINKFMAEGSRKTGFVHFMGGAPASGKTALVESGLLGKNLNTGAVQINPDEIKAMLPEYQLMLKHRNKFAAPFVHEESSDISKILTQRAASKGYDLAIDGVGDGGYEKLAGKVADLRKAGYNRIRADYVTLDTQLGQKLAEVRYNKTGRYVPPTYILEMNREIPKLVPQIQQNKLFDEFHLWDTNEKNKPRLIASTMNGVNAVHDKHLHSNFLKKAND